MDFNIGVILTTLLMVLIMEMGDKTQLLVIALTSKYRPIQVFWGIGLSILFLNILAVLLGAAIGGIKIIQDCVRIGASLLFIFFGLLTLKPEKDEDAEHESRRKKGVVITIALAFFFAEFGDKTQLSTFSFAALYPDSPFSVFLGSTIGLLSADCLGLVAGALVIKYVPKHIITYVSAVLFVVFGLINGWTTLRYHFAYDMRTSILATGAAALLSVVMAAIILYSNVKRRD
ncbi:MAG: TMEM165/GDT1 family protein [Clostridia bacterium]|nr:TMEM165/GDT1 family protein [Clostridia bacterium]